jgi:hypothetical protein
MAKRRAKDNQQRESSKPGVSTGATGTTGITGTNKNNKLTAATSAASGQRYSTTGTQQTWC